MKNNNISDTLVNSIESRIKYQHSTSMYIKVIVSFVIAVASVVILALANIDTKAPLFFFLGFMAIIGVAVGLITLFFTKKEMRLVDTNQIIRCQSFYFNATQTALDSAIAAHNFDSLKKMININDSGLRLDLLATDDASIARYQIMKYVPFEYQPCSDVVDVDRMTVEAMSKL